jgi:hypothetical protein
VSGATKLILVFAIFLLPFQLLGAAVYLILVKSNRRNAQIALTLVPAATFFVTFLALFLWRYFHPGMLMLGEGAISLFILVVMVAGTAMHLICGAIVYFILSH